MSKNSLGWAERQRLVAVRATAPHLLPVVRDYSALLAAYRQQDSVIRELHYRVCAAQLRHDLSSQYEQQLLPLRNRIATYQAIITAHRKERDEQEAELAALRAQNQVLRAQLDQN